MQSLKANKLHVQHLECPACKSRVNHIPSHAHAKDSRICPKCGGRIPVQNLSAAQK